MRAPFLKRCALLALLCLPQAAHAETAEYDVVFEGTWDASHASLPFPEGAHFTSLVGDTHVVGSALWQTGGFATLGVEDVAERGSTGAIFAEIAARVTAGSSGGQIVVSGFFGFPNEASASFLVEHTHPEISLISMVAPSPDWFVGVSGLSLRDQSGWIPQLTIDLHPYDAGTEDGSGFSLANPASSPQQPIARRGAPFFDDVVIGQLRFTRVPEPTAGTCGLTALWVLSMLRRRSGLR